MRNIYSNIIKFNSNNLNKIIRIIKKKGIIGLPTETVYGLAGNAYSNIAIKKIFNLKKRLKINLFFLHYTLIYFLAFLPIELISFSFFLNSSSMCLFNLSNLS